MADVQLKLTADVGQATKNISGFRKEYAEMVRAVEKPLQQIDVLQKTQESAKKASTAYFKAKKRVEDLSKAMSGMAEPTRAVERAYSQAQRTLARATTEFERQKAAVREQRNELRAAGVDTAKLAAEQRRLQAELAKRVELGNADSGLQKSLGAFDVTRLRTLRASLVELRTDYDRLTRSGVLSASERAAAEIKYQQQLKATRAEIATLTGATSDNGLETSFTALAGRVTGITALAFSVASAARVYVDATDRVGEMEDRLKNATSSQDEFNRAMQRLEQISGRTYTSIKSNSDLFIGSLTPLRELGFTMEDVLDMTEALGLGLVASATKGEQAASVIDQFNKAMQVGVLRGDAFNSVLQNAPELANALAKGLGVTRAELIRMAEAGQLTTERVIPALIRQMPELGQKVDEMRVTVGDAQTKMSDAFDKLIAAMDKVLGVSESLASNMSKAADSISKMADGDAQGAIELLRQLAGVLNIPGFTLFDAAGEQVVAWAADTEKAVEKVLTAEQRYALQQEIFANAERDRAIRRLVAEERAAAQREGRQFDELAATRAYAEAHGSTMDAFLEREQERNRLEQQGAIGHRNRMKQIRDGILDDLRADIASQQKLLEQAKKDLADARRQELDIEREFRELSANLRSGGAGGKATYADATDAKMRAAQALKRGDYQAAIQEARAAGEVLKALRDQGENTYGFAGMADELGRIATEAARLERVNTEEQVAGIEARISSLVAQGNALQSMQVEVGWDEQNEAQIKARMKALAEALAKQLIIPAQVVLGENPLGAPSQAAAEKPPGFAWGGWTGPGGKYQAAGVVHADEHVQPKEVVNEPGALPFLERIRRNGFRRTMQELAAQGLPGYSGGGLVRGLSVSLPAPAPSLLAAASGPTSIGTVNLTLPGGESYTLQAQPDQFDRILRRTALKFGRR